MRRLMMVACAAALALVGATATVSADSGERPFQGTLYGKVDVALAAGCPLGIKTVSDAVGTISHLGRTVMHSEHCTPMDAFNPFGEMTLTAANGDTLNLVYNGYAPYPAPTDVTIHGQGDLLVVGGTGRFTDATGGRIDDDWGSFAYVAVLEFPGYLPDGSFPPGPFATVWTIGPMTIGY